MEVPRSIIPYLESEIARLESRQVNKQHPPERLPPEGTGAAKVRPLDHAIRISDLLDHTSAPVDDRTVGVILEYQEIQQMVSATMPVGPTAFDLVGRVRMGLTPSFILPTSRPDASPKAGSEIPPRSEDTLVDCSAFASLPTHVVRGLVRNYIKILLPSMPFLDEATLWEQTENVVSSGDPEDDGVAPKQPHRIKPSYDHLVVCTVLAIAATLGCAKSAHQSRCMAFSEILFRESIQHLCNEVAFPDDLSYVQVTLLILQYAEINPKCANIWVLGGAAMRSCLDLGLHIELGRPSADGDSASLNLRRSVFWTAYCMDRMICSALDRPLSIKDPAISTRYPVPQTDSPRTGDDRLPSIRQATPALLQIRYWRLQSLIMDFHFHGHPVDSALTEADWLASTEQSLRQWHEECLPVDDAQAEFGLVFGLVSLYRPGPRTSGTPSAAALMIAYSSAVESCRIYRVGVLYGNVRRPWLATHGLAQSAMVALYCLYFSFDRLRERYSVEYIYDHMRSFTTNLLHIAGQGWSEIRRFTAKYEQLLSPLLAALLDTDHTGPVVYPSEYEAELKGYFFHSSARLEYLPSGTDTTALGLNGTLGGGAGHNWDDIFSQFSESALSFDWDWEHPATATMIDTLPMNFEEHVNFYEQQMSV